MKKRNSVLISIVTIALIVLGLLFTPFMQKIRHSTWDTLSTFLHKQDSEESQTEKETILSLTLENTRLRSELNDYARLRTDLKAPAFESMRAIPAHIIIRPIDTLQSTYIINKGITDGISVGDACIVQGGVLVGFITDASEHSAVLQTILHPNTSITAETVVTDEGEKPARGLITSQFQTAIRMATIPRDATLHQGQTVVSVSNGLTIPHGMIIGTITNIQKQENEAYQQVDIELPYNINNLTTVMVMHSL